MGWVHQWIGLGWAELGLVGSQISVIYWVGSRLQILILFFSTCLLNSVESLRVFIFYAQHSSFSTTLILISAAIWLSELCGVCSTFHDIIIGKINRLCILLLFMHWVRLCDVDIIGIKLFDNVALYMFYLLGSGLVLFVRKMLRWVVKKVGWVGLSPES